MPSLLQYSFHLLVCEHSNYIIIVIKEHRLLLNSNSVAICTWFQGKELKNNSTAGVVLSDHSLVLQGLTRYSAGAYTCLAANSEGKTASNPVSLQIMCK